jgi:hypothetical protein
MHKAGVHSWVHNPPSPFPDDQMLWARDSPSSVEMLHKVFPNRVILRVQGDGTNWTAVEVAP